MNNNLLKTAPDHQRLYVHKDKKCFEFNLGLFSQSSYVKREKFWLKKFESSIYINKLGNLELKNKLVLVAQSKWNWQKIIIKMY